METKIYKDSDGNRFLAVRVSEKDSFSDVEKFTGGKAVVTDHGYYVQTRNFDGVVELGDYIVHLSNQTPFNRVRITLDDQRRVFPKESFLLCKPDEFERNFTEVTYDRINPNLEPDTQVF